METRRLPVARGKPARRALADYGFSLPAFGQPWLLVFAVPVPVPVVLILVLVFVLLDADALGTCLVAVAFDVALAAVALV